MLLRSIVELEAAGADAFFGEPQFDVHDLMRTTADGRGIVSLLELRDVMDRPRLFSTFMLWMLAQLYAQLPEEGDLPKPKLAFFFDEAHLLFDDASDALMEQIELTARLIRSKGVGVYFVTQGPTDVPSSVLSQLGQPCAARAASAHARRRVEPAQDREDVPEERALRRGGDPHLARHRRSVRHRAVARGRAHAARGHAARAARLAHGRRRRDHARRARGRGSPAGQVRPGRRPRERARDHHRPVARRRRGRGGRGGRGAGLHTAAAAPARHAACQGVTACQGRPPKAPPPPSRSAQSRRPRPRRSRHRRRASPTT